MFFFCLTLRLIAYAEKFYSTYLNKKRIGVYALAAQTQADDHRTYPPVCPELIHRSSPRRLPGNGYELIEKELISTSRSAPEIFIRSFNREIALSSRRIRRFDGREGMATNGAPARCDAYRRR